MVFFCLIKELVKVFAEIRLFLFQNYNGSFHGARIWNCLSNGAGILSAVLGAMLAVVQIHCTNIGKVMLLSVVFHTKHLDVSGTRFCARVVFRLRNGHGSRKAEGPQEHHWKERTSLEELRTRIQGILEILRVTCCIVVYFDFMRTE